MSVSKAELLASSFAEKWDLPVPEQNLFSDVSDILVGPDREGFLRIRVRSARGILSSLRADSGTGPDLLPARVLKICAQALALPVCLQTFQVAGVLV